MIVQRDPPPDWHFLERRRSSQSIGWSQFGSPFGRNFIIHCQMLLSEDLHIALTSATNQPRENTETWLNSPESLPELDPDSERMLQFNQVHIKFNPKASYKVYEWSHPAKWNGHSRIRVEIYQMRTSYLCAHRRRGRGALSYYLQWQVQSEGVNKKVIEARTKNEYVTSVINMNIIISSYKYFTLCILNMFYFHI